MEGGRFMEPAGCGFALPLRQVDYALLRAGRPLGDGRRGVDGYPHHINPVEELGCRRVDNNTE
jgi:hypothetical protein